MPGPATPGDIGTGASAGGATGGGVGSGPLATLVVAIDGPSGSGKSTVARRVASALGLRYLDTGALYRAVTWAALAASVDVSDRAAVERLARTVRLDLDTDPQAPTISVDGRDVSREIRSRAVAAAVSAVAALPEVRRLLLPRQRAIIGAGGVVVEGRDIASVVAPEAAVKVFLTASAEARAVRRHRDEVDSGEAESVDTTLAELQQRDALDSGRRSSPLAQAPDAVVLDSTDLGIEETVDQVLDLCRLATSSVDAP